MAITIKQVKDNRECFDAIKRSKLLARKLQWDYPSRNHEIVLTKLEEAEMRFDYESPLVTVYEKLDYNEGQEK